ncbi:MAG: ATP-binding protein [Methanimicrococcus sp.]|nr:ATP-binding protein [Methanimicrococcus sp.]
MDELSFKVSSALKSIIGKDLITDDFIAIFELVKNSYDAFSKKVEIIFEPDKIIIKDDGKGMSLEDIINKWLFVAYSAKIDGTEDLPSEKNTSYRDNIKRKYYAGSKGIGRFSCDRVGQKLVLTSRKKGTDFTERVYVDWDSFEKDPKKEFYQIKVNHETVSNYFDSGVVLEISSLRSKWDYERKIELKQSLEKLINPFDSLDFEIWLTSTSDLSEDDKGKSSRKRIHRQGTGRYLTQVNGPVNNFIFEKLNLKTTQIKTSMSDEWITTELVDRGTLIYKVREKNIHSSFLNDASFHIYYLNTIAKTNFTRTMGIEPVRFGSIFLFKNGFRVSPYGALGDDSLGIDFRHQQGNRRFLGTRDLFGRIELITDSSYFREASSRDGGLVETPEYLILKELFFEKSLKPLERYIGFVQWGLGWESKGFFTEKELLDGDKNREDTSIIQKNLGSRFHLVKIIKKLSDNKDIEILEYDKDLFSIIKDNLEKVNPSIFKDISKIATKTNNSELFKSVEDAEKKYVVLLNQKMETERKFIEEEKKRIEAEEQKKAEEEARKKAETERQKEEEARKKAELAQREAELKKREAEQKRKEAEEARKKAETERQKEEEAREKAELAQREAELKKREEEFARKEAEQKAKDESEKRANAEKEREEAVVKFNEEKKRRLFQSSLIGMDKEHIMGLQHNIGHSSSRIIENANSLLRSKNVSEKDLAKIYTIMKESSKIKSVSNFITRANFGVNSNSITRDLVQFIKEYVEEIYLSSEPLLNTKLKIHLTDNNKEFVKEFSPLEVTILIDNFINNAEKAGASDIYFDFNVTDLGLRIAVEDNGKGIAAEHLDQIFDLGFTTTDGSGIGLYIIKSTIQKDMKGKITVSSEENVKTVFIIELGL